MRFGLLFLPPMGVPPEFAPDGAPPFDTSRSTANVALVLYGRIGTYTTRAANMVHAPNALASMDLWLNCALSLRKRLIEPWKRQGKRFHIYMHSYNPELKSHVHKVYGEPHQTTVRFETEQPGLIKNISCHLGLCDRIKYAMLSMREALRLRKIHESRLADAGLRSGIIIMMRPDVYWKNELPVVPVNERTRVWLPRDCHMAQAANNSVIIQAKRSVLGRACNNSNDVLPFCENAVNVDYWFIADAALGNRFSDTFEKFSLYSRMIAQGLRFHNSAPHFYWGLFFHHMMQLRASCQIGHVGFAFGDFQLGRFERNGGTSCRLAPSVNVWHSLGPGPGCDARLIPGYNSLCAAPPPEPVPRVECHAFAVPYKSSMNWSQPLGSLLEV